MFRTFKSSSTGGGGVESALSYWQGVDRCTRNLDRGLAILYAYKRSLQQCKDSTMKVMVNQEKCARDTILDIFKIPGTPDLEKRERASHKCTEKAPCMCCSSCLKMCTFAHKYACVLARLVKVERSAPFNILATKVKCFAPLGQHIHRL
eukprot:XP_011670205.1 PREDICTED: uncharacterized protein LOC105441091 [Strongylocentrotus purpuratus]